MLKDSCVSLQDSEKYVEQLLTLFNRFSKLVKEAFQDDPRFLTARDKVSVLSIHIQSCTAGLSKQAEWEDHTPDGHQWSVMPFEYNRKLN